MESHIEDNLNSLIWDGYRKQKIGRDALLAPGYDTDYSTADIIVSIKTIHLKNYQTLALI